MIFEFYWTWYEDYSPILMEGPEKTQSEFESDCKKALKEACDSYLSQVKKERTRAGLPDWIELAAKRMEDYGYRIFKPMRFGYFGSYIFKDEDIDGRSDMQEFSDEIKQMIEFNKSLQRRKGRDSLC